MFYKKEFFGFTQGLESAWSNIRDELLALPGTQFIPWPEKSLYDNGWDVFGLYAFGKKLPDNCLLCPETTRLIESIPGLVTAGFSSLKPMTHIRPHKGYTYPDKDAAVLRCHLGLVVPQIEDAMNCALRVGDEIRPWGEGECFVFDDTMIHEAWNRSFGIRVVLLLDFKKSEFSVAL